MDIKNLSRRDFLSIAGLAGAGLGLAACTTAPAATPTPMDMGSPTPQGGVNADEMDKLHKAGVDAFLGNIGKEDNFWRTTPLAFKLDGDTKVFDITCTDGQWETAPGQAVQAMMYNGLVPGPTIRVTEGDKVRVNVTNQMAQSTGVHFHGVDVENKWDGVPYVTQDPIKKGQTFTYEFQPKNVGSHMYHSHHNAAEQVTKGLFAAFIIDPKVEKYPVAADYIFAVNDTGVGLTINGRSFPYTQPMAAKVGDKIRIRYMNEGLLIHPMHLHGMPQLVVAKDGYDLASPYQCDTLLVAPGERYDVIVDCEKPGLWAYHCHILTHAESAKGMFGMVTVLKIA